MLFNKYEIGNKTSSCVRSNPEFFERQQIAKPLVDTILNVKSAGRM
jgi:hypothetical protein